MLQILNALERDRERETHRTRYTPARRQCGWLRPNGTQLAWESVCVSWTWGTLDRKGTQAPMSTDGGSQVSSLSSPSCAVELSSHFLWKVFILFLILALWLIEWGLWLLFRWKYFCTQVFWCTYTSTKVVLGRKILLLDRKFLFLNWN